MSAVTGNDFTAFPIRSFEDAECIAQNRSKRNVVLFVCVLVAHAIAGYAITHIKVTSSSNPLLPIEVQFIEDTNKSEETPKISPPAHVQTNLTTPAMPTLDTFAPEAPDATVVISVTPVTNVGAQRSDGDISTSPKLVSEVAYVRAPKPKYPTAARSLRLSGVVVLRILIDEHGRPAQISVQRSSGHRLLDDAAHDAAIAALFKPYVEDGVARQVFVLVPIEFGARS